MRFSCLYSLTHTALITIMITNLQASAHTTTINNRSLECVSDYRWRANASKIRGSYSEGDVECLLQFLRS